MPKNNNDDFQFFIKLIRSIQIIGLVFMLVLMIALAFLFRDAPSLNSSLKNDPISIKQKMAR